MDRLERHAVAFGAGFTEIRVLDDRVSRDALGRVAPTRLADAARPAFDAALHEEPGFLTDNARVAIEYLREALSPAAVVPTGGKTPEPAAPDAVAGAMMARNLAALYVASLFPDVLSDITDSGSRFKDHPEGRALARIVKHLAVETNRAALANLASEVKDETLARSIAWTAARIAERPAANDVQAPAVLVPAPRPKPGDELRAPLRDGGTGPTLMYIPAGKFLMGMADGEGKGEGIDNNWRKRSRPRTQIEFANG